MTVAIDLDAATDQKVTILKKNKSIDIDSEKRHQRNDQAQITKISSELDDVVYLNNGKNVGCVVRQGERDGKSGFYIEWHETKRNSPPIYESIFVEAE